MSQRFGAWPRSRSLCAGRHSLRARAGATAEGTSAVLEVWGRFGVLKELHVPKAQHGAVFADGWFSGCAWSPDEQRVAYVAEACAPAPAAGFLPPCTA